MWREPALVQEEFSHLETPEIYIRQLFHARDKLGLRQRFLEARERQVRIEGALLAGEAQLLHRGFDPRSKFRKCRRRFNPRPEDSRAAGTREESKAADLYRELFKLTQIRQRIADGFHLFLGNLTQKFERQMNSFRPRPPSSTGDSAQTLLLALERRVDFFGQVNGDKSSHGKGSNLKTQ